MFSLRSRSVWSGLAVLSLSFFASMAHAEKKPVAIPTGLSVNEKLVKKAGTVVHCVASFKPCESGESKFRVTVYPLFAKAISSPTEVTIAKNATQAEFDIRVDREPGAKRQPLDVRLEQVSPNVPGSDQVSKFFNGAIVIPADAELKAADKAANPLTANKVAYAIGHSVIKYADQAAALPTTLMVNPAVVDTVGQRVHFVLNLIRWSGDSEFKVYPFDDSIELPSQIKVPAYAAKVEFEGKVKALRPGEFFKFRVMATHGKGDKLFERAVKFKAK